MRRVVLLVVFGVLLGALLTGGAGALPGSQGLNALSWVASVSTVAALVVAVGIFRVQQVQSDLAHQELIDALRAQDEILQDLAEATPATDAAEPSRALDRDEAPSASRAPAPAATPPADEGVLTAAHREAIEARYGDRSIDRAWEVGRGPGDRPRLVKLDDGTLVTVFTRGRGGGVQLHQVKPRGERNRPPRGDERSRPPRGDERSRPSRGEERSRPSGGRRPRGPGPA